MSTYLEARKSFGLSRETLSGLAKLAGVRISPTSIKKLETEGEKAIGTRGVSADAVAYIDYVLGIGTFEATDWDSVDRGAPVIVSGEKGTFSYISHDGESTVTVFGSGKLKHFPGDQVRLVAPTALPSDDSAYLFETRTRGDGGAYAKQVMNYIENHADMPHSVGALSYSLGLDNAVVSRTVAGLVKAGKLSKAGRGVVVLGGTAASDSAPVAAEEPVQETQSENEDIPRF